MNNSSHYRKIKRYEQDAKNDDEVKKYVGKNMVYGYSKPTKDQPVSRAIFQKNHSMQQDYIIQQDCGNFNDRQASKRLSIP